jgi:hypothetical protein
MIVGGAQEFNSQYFSHSSGPEAIFPSRTIFSNWGIMICVPATGSYLMWCTINGMPVVMHTWFPRGYRCLYKFSRWQRQCGLPGKTYNVKCRFREDILRDVTFSYTIGEGTDFVGKIANGFNETSTGSLPPSSFSVIAAVGLSIAAGALVALLILIVVSWCRKAKRNEPITIENKQ